MLNNLFLEYFDLLNFIDDRVFDMVFPSSVRKLSYIHWTPASLSVKAANLLVPSPGTRVLDIGSGPGKFCIIGSMTTKGFFTGVEYRKSLVNISRKLINQYALENVEIIHSNILNIDFSEYDSFYFFNPFYENIVNHLPIIDSSTRFSLKKYQEYSDYVYKQFEKLKPGTRIVTLCTSNNQLPPSYSVIYEEEKEDFKLWIKNDHE